MLRALGAGLTKSNSDNVVKDARVLNNNFVIVDGTIATSCAKRVDYLLFGGNEAALGIKNKSVAVDGAQRPVVPLILPMNPHHGSFEHAREGCRTAFHLLHSDAAGGARGLVSRTMDYVCSPILRGGSILKGTHFNDLMQRLNRELFDVEKGANVYQKLRNPRLVNLVKCLQFYLFVHVGLSSEEALKAIRKRRGFQDAHDQQQDIYLTARKLRVLGDTGPVPKDHFAKIVRHYLLVNKPKVFLEPDEVQREIDELKQKLSKFRLFGKSFSRKLLPGFMSTPRPDAGMGVPRNKVKINGARLKLKQLTRRPNRNVATRQMKVPVSMFG